MFRLLCRTVVLLVGLSICVAAVAGEPRSTASRLKSALAAQQISADDAVLYTAIALRAPWLLPEQYVDTSGQPCDGELFEILSANVRKVHPEVRAVLRYVLSPPNKQAAMKKPAIKAAKIQDPALAEQVVAIAWTAASTLYVPTAHFRVAYTISGADATTLAYAQNVAARMEEAYAAESGLAFTMPAAPNDGKIDVAIWASVCLTPDPAGLLCGSNVGIAIPAAFSTIYDGDGDPLIGIRTALSDELLRVTTAHELFHQVQYQMAGATTIVSHAWVREGQATAVEDVVWPNVNDYFSQVTEFYNSIENSLDNRSYDAVLFWKYLIMAHSGGTVAIIRDFLSAAGASGVDDALDIALTSHGTTLDAAVHAFGLWNLFAGNRYRSGYYDDANLTGWPSLVASASPLGSITSVPAAPMYIPASALHYVLITADSTVLSNRKLTIKVHGDADGHVRAWVVHRRVDGSVAIQDMHLENNGGTGTEFINDFSNATTSEVFVILSNGSHHSELLADYSAKLPTSIDLAFCMDTTGSMYGSISALKSTAMSAMTTLGSNGADFRMAITEFKDFPVYPYGESSDYPYRANSPFSSTPSVILGGINMLYSSGGSDWAESTLSGIMGAINAQNIGPWRSGVNKSIVVMTDAPPHDPEPLTGYTGASVSAAALAGGITVSPFSTVLAKTSQSMQTARTETPIKIFGVVVGSDDMTYAALSGLAGATGGKVWRTSYDSADIAAAILAAIGEISEGEEPPPPPANHPPNAAGAIADPTQLWPPDNKMMAVAITNVTDPDGDAVAIRIDSITQDEPLKDREADGEGVGTSAARVRAARDGNGNGRVYVVSFTATDAHGSTSSGRVSICVPHDRGGNTVCTDDGQTFGSTNP